MKIELFGKIHMELQFHELEFHNFILFYYFKFDCL